MWAIAVTILVLLSATPSQSLGIDGVRSLDIRGVPRSSCDETGGICSDVVCSTQHINVTLKVDKLQEKSIDVSSLYLRDRRCTGFRYDDEFVYISWSLGSGVCGTELIFNETHVIYKNQVFMPPDISAVIWREALILNVSCTYPRNLNTSLDQVLWPDLSIKYISIGDAGKFKVKMAIYHDIGYNNQYTTSPVVISTEDNLYVSVYLANEDNSVSDNKDFKLLMLNCYSTPTNNVHDSVRYNIIADRCPNPKDATIRILENGISNQGKFYFQMFKFIGDYPYVFIHCQVYLCSNICAPTCSSRSAQETYEPHGTLSIGPIRAGNSVDKATGLSFVTILGLVLANMYFI